MHQGRGHFVAGAASLVLAGGFAPFASGQEKKGTRLILLGTKGGPRVGGVRNNPSNLLRINKGRIVVGKDLLEV